MATTKAESARVRQVAVVALRADATHVTSVTVAAGRGPRVTADHRLPTGATARQVEDCLRQLGPPGEVIACSLSDEPPWNAFAWSGMATRPLLRAEDLALRFHAQLHRPCPAHDVTLLVSRHQVVDVARGSTPDDFAHASLPFGDEELPAAESQPRLERDRPHVNALLRVSERLRREIERAPVLGTLLAEAGRVELAPTRQLEKLLRQATDAPPIEPAAVRTQALWEAALSFAEWSGGANAAAREALALHELLLEAGVTEAVLDSTSLARGLAVTAGADFS